MKQAAHAQQEYISEANSASTGGAAVQTDTPAHEKLCLLDLTATKGRMNAQGYEGEAGSINSCCVSSPIIAGISAMPSEPDQLFLVMSLIRGFKAIEKEEESLRDTPYECKAS